MALSNTQYESIMKSYEQVRERNRKLLSDRQEEVYLAIPELEELNLSVGSISAAHARQLLSGEEDAPRRLHASLSEIASRRRALLSAANFPADYLEPVYDCPDCKDTGYVQSAEGLKEKCHCFRRREIALLYEQSNIQDMISRENFSTLSYSYYQGEDLERFTRVVKICKDFVQNFIQDYQNLFFYGTVGTGKSFLSGCVAEQLLKQGHSVIYFSAASLFDTLAKYAFQSKEKEALSNFYQDLYQCELLIIDDLGTEITNAFVTSQLFACLNERNLRKRATVISTNLSLEELRDRYSDRIFSRITSNYTLCKLTGPDIRLSRKMQA
ncbi:MAG: ATP-binding protein [Lachnoclostridium sp.]|nr:ATP-binding protein [Lachnospira sp.]MCM1248468.1 ATP-binding protein [Lachnoclostridium sp.]MCM1535968.1 ATP-binding protein [Clostridium sp.]